jgi:putative sugar O-methyltransferase
MSSEPDTTTPSHFWRDLAGAHVEQLSHHGLGEIKRQQALRYFTWQWRWSQRRNSEQLRYLLANTTTLAKVEATLARQPLTEGLWRGPGWSRRDRWFYAFATRLIWTVALTQGSSDVLALGEPSLGNPPPVLRRGALISQDLANSALEVAAIRRALQGRTPTSILEVGAGYGRSAYALLGVFPKARYTIVDILPARSLSTWYLSTLYPDRDITFLAPEEATPARLGHVDLAISISSLQEMTPRQVAHYLDLFNQTVEGTVFLKQWQRWTNHVDGVVLDMDDYPVPTRWNAQFNTAAPVQTAFVEAAWHVTNRVDDGRCAENSPTEDPERASHAEEH